MKDLRREVVVAAEEAPHAAVVVAALVALAHQQPAHGRVLDRVAHRVRVGHGGELEVEVVERPRVAIPRLARQAVGDRVVEAALLPLHVVRQPLVGDFAGDGGADAQAHEDLRIATREHRLEALAEHQAVEPRGRRDQRRRHLAPEPRAVAAALEHEAGHPEGRLADEAAAERVAQRLPVLEPGRAREAVVDAALVGMPDLVDAERILVVDGRRPQIFPERVGVGVVVVAAQRVAVELVEPDDEPADLERGNPVALALARVPAQRGRAPLLGPPDGTGQDADDEGGGRQHHSWQPSDTARPHRRQPSTPPSAAWRHSAR